MKQMKSTRKHLTKSYAQKNPLKAKLIKKAVKQGLKQYAETFRRLATS